MGFDLLCSAPDMKALGVRTILDLRRMDRPCKKKGNVLDTVRLVGRYAVKVGVVLSLHCFIALQWLFLHGCIAQHFLPDPSWPACTLLWHQINKLYNLPLYTCGVHAWCRAPG